MNDFDTLQITVTDSAKEKIQEILSEMNGTKKSFRIYVQGGGCSGFQYGFSIDDSEEDDLEIVNNDVNILIDYMSAQYLQGCTVNYTEEFMDCKFEIINPNAASTCGCGSSFSI